ncbi:MAG TPA: 4-alpha-glucanotransferase [Pyrinomonadaceae bacterium]|nr:4-alpha-glucanotransferase [Pyrinomonadaceae bacterium]
MKLTRSSGVLLHPTSLPGRFGIGDLGPAAYRFVDFLAESGQTYWQIMPLGPTGYGDSPYSSFSAFAGNTLLVSPERLAEDGLLSEDDLKNAPDLPAGRVDFERVIKFKRDLLQRAFENYKKDDSHLRGEYAGFQSYASAWLDDWSLFAALKGEHKGASWHTWQRGIARRDAGALDYAREAFSERIEAHKFFQFLFFYQWFHLKKHCASKGVRIVGDMPIFVAHNSADVWSRPELFQLNEDGSPRVVAGVPPDAFSKTGQLWGNPLYDWEAMRRDDFRWWADRMRSTLTLVDVVRVDHFRGFAAYWEVPADHETAEHGRWVNAPGRELFNSLGNTLGELKIIAEDLGTITPDVHELRDEFGFPGMRVLQFAFGGDPQDTHLPHNYERNTVVYTGTHDNDTTAGWFAARSDEAAGSDEALKRERENALKYLGTDGGEINWDFIREAFKSVAELAVVPAQDLLGLGSEARMNTPASAEGNWAWRLAEGALTDDLRDRLKDLTTLCGRLPRVEEK